MIKIFVKNKYTYFWLGLIVLVGFVVRIAFIQTSPARMTVDELSIGYNAYSILKTGKDEWRTRIPLLFRAFGDYKLPAYIYASVPSVALLGLTVMAVKLPSIVSGSLLIVAIFWLVWEITKKKNLALGGSLIVAISPWTIHISRMALESNIALLLLCFGLASMFYGLRVRKRWVLAMAGGLLGLSLYAYVAYRMFVVMFLLFGSGLVFFFKRDLLKFLAPLLIAFIVVLLPIAPQFISSGGTARFSQVGILNDAGVAQAVDDHRAMCHLANSHLDQICKGIFNKPQEISSTLLTRYTRFLMPTFLFLDGDTLTYLQIPHFGEFYLVLLPFYVVGLVLLLKEKNWRYRLMLLGLLLSPIPAAIAGEPQIVRGSMMVPFLILAIVLGAGNLIGGLKGLKKRVVLGLLAIFLFTSTVFYLFNFYVIYPRAYDAAANPLSEEVVAYILAHEDKYDQIYVSDHFNDAHISLAFYGKIDPLWYQENVVWPEPDAYGFTHPSSLGKFEFGPLAKSDLSCDGKSVLFVGSPNETDESLIEFTNFSGVHAQAKLYELCAAH